MTVKERRSLLKDLRKFGVAEWSYSFATGETKIVFASEAVGRNAGQPGLRAGSGTTVPKAQSTDGPPQQQGDNPYQELASAVGLDWARISGQHVGETD